MTLTIILKNAAEYEDVRQLYFLVIKCVIAIQKAPKKTYKTRIISNGYKLEQRLHYFEEFDYLIINSYDSEEKMAERKKQQTQ